MTSILNYIWANLWWLWPSVIGFIVFINWVYWIKYPEQSTKHLPKQNILEQEQQKQTA